jgi:hypothetical protein
MVGVITERDLAEAEQEFPGIARYFDDLSDKPRTFLELVSRFEHWCEPVTERERCAA